MSRFVDFAKTQQRIRLVTLEGSRTNKNVPRDRLQDFDISFFVTDLDYFKQDDRWLDAFGARLMMQKPEDMELFPAELEIGFSYIVLLDDGSKLDLTLFTLEDIDEYFRISDGLVEVLLDKDKRIGKEIVATDRQYWIQKPSARAFDDCCNEYWMVSTYVTKGLLRSELLYAIDHLNEILRPNLLRMMSWLIGAERGYHFSVGKNYKYLDKYLPSKDWETLLSTFAMNSPESLERSLSTCHELFRRYSSAVAERLGYTIPDYDEAVSKYTELVRNALALDGKQ